MPKFFKFMIVAIPVLLIGAFMGYQDHMKPVSFSAEGVINEINWKSRNHGMPVIEIMADNGSVKVFSSNRITLNSDLLKVGDYFSKESGSKSCKINASVISCIN